MQLARYFKKPITCILVSLMLASGLISSAQAETYVGASVGASFGGSLGNTTYRGNAPFTANTLTIPELDLDASTAWGVRVGHYFSFLPWLGVEFQWYRRQPDADTSAVTLTGSVPGATGPFNFTGAANASAIVDNMDTFGFLFNIRAPENMVQNWGGIEPYVGVGLAVNSIDIEEFRLSNPAGTFTTRSASGGDVDAGFLGQVGANYIINKRLRAFGEYKYTHANFTSNQWDPTGVTETDFEDHTVVFGLKFTLFE